MQRTILAAIPVLLAVGTGFAQGPEFAATIGQAFAGPLGGDTANTMVTVTNRDLQNCTIGFFFQATTTSNPAIFLNGVNTPSLDLTIPSGGARMVTMTANELVQGLMNIFAVPPCSPSSVSIAANYTIQGPGGEVREVFTLRPNGPGEWLRDGSCRVVTTNQDPTGEGGLVQNLGVATSSVSGAPAPTGTTVSLTLYDDQGEPIGASTFPVTGEHSASFPIPESISGKVTVVFCLATPSTFFNLDLTPIKLVQGQDSVQFDNAIFADGFESGDTSAWSVVVP